MLGLATVIEGALQVSSMTHRLDCSSTVTAYKINFGQSLFLKGDYLFVINSNIRAHQVEGERKLTHLLD